MRVGVVCSRGKKLGMRQSISDRMDHSAEQSLVEAHNFYDRMKLRNTVRNNSVEPVSKEVIEKCIRTAGTAPSGANHQPWHFVAISDPDFKKRTREATEAEERRFYDGGVEDEWLKALEPIGSNDDTPYLEDAAWLIFVFAQRWGQFDDGTRFRTTTCQRALGSPVAPCW